MWIEDKYSGQQIFTFYINNSKKGKPIKFYVPAEISTGIMMLNLNQGDYDLSTIDGRQGKAYLYYDGNGDENEDIGPQPRDEEKAVEYKEKISLDVGDAFPYEVCNGIARMDIDSMQQISVLIGDTIEISANGTSDTAVVVEGFPGEGKEMIFIDDKIKRKLGLQTGDEVIAMKKPVDAKSNVQKALKSKIYPVTLGVICRDEKTQKMIESEITALTNKLKQIQKDNPGVIFVKSISSDLPFAILPIIGGDRACARVMEGWRASIK